MAEDRHSDVTDKDLLWLLLEFKDYAVIRISREGVILSWNLGAEHIYGFAYSDVVGKHYSVLYINEKQKKDSADKLLQIAAKLGRYEEEEEKQRKDGTAFHANIIISALYSESRVVAGFAHVTRDITATKKLEEENRLLRNGLEEKVKQRTKDLEVVNKELEAFSYSVSHDLRTPLRAISGYSMMLKEDYQSGLDTEGNRLIDTILANTKMMSELIDDLLTFSKMARLEAIHASVDMHQLVQHCLEKLTAIEKCPAVSIGALPLCMGDQSMLRQVWYNLLDNAIKYSSKKDSPQIEIGTLTDSQYHIYFIKDNGAGFDMKYAPRLFGVFQRLHRQDDFEGTGLGLALVKRIISKHGGEIWADAVPQQGAAFYFSIPKTNHA
ncbi:MAG TPA: ATP-binding protein [Chitinophagaceae bacterium]|jgi:PAS domain S-box-containing protein|nr:ATP-binding protein [Chitinophagaceae bacterium]